MKKWLFAWGVLILLAGALAYSQTTETFSNYVAGLPSATTPLAPGDQHYVLQGGLSRKVTQQNLCPPATSAVVGCSRPDGVTIGISGVGVLTTIGGGGGGGTNLGWVVATAAPFNATGNGTTDDTAAIQAAIDFAYSSGIQTIYLPKPAVCYKTTAPLYLDAPGNLRSSISTPTNFAFSLSLLGEPGGGNHEDAFGSKICTGANYTVLYVGPGQGMRVSHITLEGVGGLQAGAYRCGRGPATALTPEAGIYIAGGGGGSSRAKINDVMIEGYYYGITVGLNNGALGDSNSFEKILINNTCKGITLGATQNFINDCNECNVGANTALDTTLGGGMTVTGGNWSTNSGLATGVMTLSAWSPITVTNPGNNFAYAFTATLSAPAFSGVTSYAYGDVVSQGGQVWWCINFLPACTGTTPSLAVPSTWEPIANYINGSGGNPGILNAFAIVTTHYGVIPLTVTNFVQATSVISLSIPLAWSTYLPQFNLVANGDLQVEVQTGTTLYAAERGTTFSGASINAKGVHIENPGIPTLLFSSGTVLNGATGDVFENIRMNNNPAEVGGLGGTPANAAKFYISQTFPIIAVGNVGMTIRSSALNINGANPGMIDYDGMQLSPFKMDDMNFQVNPMVERIFSNGQFGLSGVGVGSFGLGQGIFEVSPFTPKQQPPGGIGSDGAWWHLNAGRSTHWGYRPAPKEHPCITPAQFTSLNAPPAWINSGGNITIGYPTIYGGQIYSICDWFVGTQSSYHFESKHHFYSYGQNITTTNVPGLSWSYKGQGAWVYANAQALSVLFPGLGVILNDGSSDVQYIVNGVWPTLGYFTVIRGDNANGGIFAGNLSGSKTAVITGTLIKQEAFSFVFP